MAGRLPTITGSEHCGSAPRTACSAARLCHKNVGPRCFHERDWRSVGTRHFGCDQCLRQGGCCRTASGGELQPRRSQMKLREAIELYVAFRKSAGADFRSSEHVLATFCSSITKEVNVEDVDEKHVAAFLRGKGNFTRYWHRKHSALLGFYRYAVSR